jgi:Calcineurin-like phosphoesterase
MRHTLLIVAAVSAAALLAGCAGFVAQPGPEPETRSPSRKYVILTTPIVAVGDTQEHLATGFPMHDNDSAVDAYVEVAQRPPQQPLFGRRILEWALQNHVNDPFIHMGDVLDLSCRIEAQRMDKVFRAAGRAGVILPGNHDGLMFGIYGYNLFDAVLDTDARKWNQACRRGAAAEDKAHKSISEAMSKRDFIARYLSNQVQAARMPGLPTPPDTGNHRVSWRSPDPAAFVSAIEAQLLQGYAYADSFVAHRIKLPRAPGATRDVILIGLDTNQAGPLVSALDAVMGKSPGSMGHVHPDQIRAIAPWVTDAAVNGDIVVFAGHHNWRSLGLHTRVLLGELMSNVPNPLAYLSGHTHRGFWALHTTQDRRPLLELNVSSLSDWPIAYRRISFAYDAQNRRLMVRGDLMPAAKKVIESDADLIAAWDAQTCARVGLAAAEISRADLELVQRQRASRGTVMSWLVESLAPVCERCEQLLYEHAQSYQDELLDALTQIDIHIPRHTHRLHEVQLPAWCANEDFIGCARKLRVETATDFRSHVALFRRKASLVALLNDHLDDLTTPEARAYMTCRAVQAAKIDFDATDDDHKSHRSEENRRSEQFFRVEASVGME